MAIFDRLVEATNRTGCALVTVFGSDARGCRPLCRVQLFTTILYAWGGNCDKIEGRQEKDQHASLGETGGARVNIEERRSSYGHCVRYLWPLVDMERNRLQEEWWCECAAAPTPRDAVSSLQAFPRQRPWDTCGRLIGRRAL
jgi:hypothetical protein